MRTTILTLVAALCLPLSACDLLFGMLGSGAECSQDSDCFGDDLCVDGECVECENDRDCDDDEECDNGECERVTSEGEGEGEGGAGEGEGEGSAGEGEGEGSAGEGEGEGSAGCGSVPETGVCVGNTMRYCDTETNTVEEENCSSFTPDLQCQPAHGLNMCAADLGADCIVDNGTDLVIAFCADTGVGCKLGSGTTGVCEAGPSTCATTDVNRCIGGDFILRCTAQIGFAWYADCDGRSGTCDNTQGGCILPAASACIPDEGSGYTDYCAPPGGTGTPTACPAGGTCP